MIFLELHNRAVEELLLVKFENAKQGLKHEKLDHILADFDGVVYRVHSLPNDKSKIVVSISLNFFPELQEHGADEFLQREYGVYLCGQSEQGCSVSLVYDLDHLPADYEQLARQASLLKRNCFAAVFERFFEFHALCEGTAEGLKRAVIHNRADETLYIQAQADRVTVIFSTIFKDPDDVIIGKVFLQELNEGSPPAELMGTDAAIGDNVAYITFVLFPRHLTPTAVPRTINLIYSLRNYLHYHIKCCKGYIHRRMRAKTVEFIKILNRAQPQYTAMPVVQVGAVLPGRIPSTTSFSNLYLSNGAENNDDEDNMASVPSEFTNLNGYI
ncbi:hypothetical protein AHF37_06938 [Paragonimus kellicotti]|nr:hypothetical protein AHF37_06938 [Paragonimus kellicotti]